VHHFGNLSALNAALPHDDFGFSVFDGDNVVENYVRIARDRCLAWPATRCLQKWHRAKIFLRPLEPEDGTNEKPLSAWFTQGFRRYTAFNERNDGGAGGI
jgi:hypothetical protein